MNFIKEKQNKQTSNRAEWNFNLNKKKTKNLWVLTFSHIVETVIIQLNNFDAYKAREISDLLDNSLADNESTYNKIS